MHPAFCLLHACGYCLISFFQFHDDLDYLLDGLKPSHDVSTRCLSALELASKCLSPNFRMHVKAHGLIETIFTSLQDALSNEVNLAFYFIFLSF